MNLRRWGYESPIINEAELSVRKIMVKEQYRTPLWRASRDVVLVVTEGAVQMEHGEHPKSLPVSWGNEDGKFVLEKGDWYRFTGVRDSILYEHAYGEEDEIEGAVGEGSLLDEEDFRDLLLSYVLSTMDTGEVLEISDAGEVADALARKGRLVGVCNGCFDMLHPGHAELLLQAKQRCDSLFVVMNTDSSVSKLKGESRPIISEEGRAIMLSCMRFVDHVVMNESLTCVEAVKAIKPDVYVTTPSGVEGPEAKATLALGGRVEVIDPLPRWSTTNLVNKVLEAR
jgi:rfaE bifunctional protein nucleotidyltransferase chain/domain